MNKRYRKYLLGFLAAFTLAGCGRSADQRPHLPAPARKIDASSTGSITGTVRLEGEPAASKPIDMSAEPYCEKLNAAPAFPRQVASPGAGDLANVVVYVRDFPADYIVDAPGAAATLSQRGCLYDPRVVALRTGQALEIKNEDQATHNILAMPEQNPKWNRSETPGAAPIEETFMTPELAIPLRCNVHPWMKSYVFVFSHPYYAVTGKDGRFTLKDVPPGTYTVEAWKEKYGKQDATITVGPKESKSVDFEFNAATGAGN